MHMGNMTKDFVPVGKEEQAEIKNEDNSEKVASLLGIGKSTKIDDNLVFSTDCEWMINYFCKPKLKVGTEWMNKGSTCTTIIVIIMIIITIIITRSELSG